MRILVLTSDARWVNAVRTAFGSGHDVVAGDPRQVPMLASVLPVIDACFVAEKDTSAVTTDGLKQLSALTDVPLFAVADTVRPEWEEAALISGARQVFTAPLRTGIVQLAVSRAVRSTVPAFPREGASRPPLAFEPSDRDSRELALLRGFNRLLVYSASDPQFKTGYLDGLREALGCGRLVLYVRRNVADLAFELEAATGVDVRQFDGFRVHLGHGLGRLMGARGGAIVRPRLRGELPEEAVAGREMNVFGADLAIPLVASTGFIGVLLVGPRIAGPEYSDQEVTQLYHLMEGFAAAITRPAPPPAAPPADSPFPTVLRALPVGCALVNDALHVLEANEAFLSQLGRDTANQFGIARLPETWTTALESLRDKRGTQSHVELAHELSGAERRIRLALQEVETPSAAERRWLIVTEDITNETRLQQELHDRSSHNVLQRAGEQLSNEFRNSLTPIEILVQLSREPNGRHDIDRLRAPVSMAIHRLRRRVDNLGYLTKTSIVPELTTVSAVFRSARERLDYWLEAKQLKTLVWSGEFSKVAFTADSAAIGLAVAELVMNAVEAAGGRQVTITADDLPDAVHFKIRNPGEWSPPSESTGFGHRPFFTAKSAGVGLGVEVASRVAEYHGGRLVLGPVADDVVEAILRLPRNLPVVPTAISTPVTAAL